MKRPTRRILDATERAHLKSLYNERMVQLNNPELQMGPGGPMWTPGRAEMQNRGSAIRDAEKYKRILEEGDPSNVSPRERRDMEKAKKVLEDEIRRGLIPRKLLHMKKEDATDYHKAVKGCVEESNPVFVEKVNRLRDIYKTENPDDPKAGSIEHLRE